VPGIRGVIGGSLFALIGAFLGAILSRIAAFLLPAMRATPLNCASGPTTISYVVQVSNCESASTVISYVAALEQHFVLVALLGALVLLLSRSIVRTGVVS
jgi:hypothetical protein